MDTHPPEQLKPIAWETLAQDRRRTWWPSAAIAAESIIDAPMADVWSVLVALDRYDQWNPFTPRIDRRALEVGASVTLHVQMRPPPAATLRQVEQITHLDHESHRIDWGTLMAHPWVLRACRTQRLEALGPERTRYWTEDLFVGALVPVVMVLYRNAIQRGFEQVASSLKKTCERQT
ncbi:MAG: SRPBCC domain-containing protein [Myxococcota bacterium]